MKKIIIFTSLFVLIDQLIKWMISAWISISSSLVILPDFFSITHVRNIGAAWSILEGGRSFLILMTFIALLSIYLIFLKGKKFTKLDILTYASLLGGIIGNLLDRIFRGYVVDYLEFHIFGYAYPIFNLADILIVVSVACIIIGLIKEEKHGNNRS